jgi:phage tail sheath protein FI
MPEYLAPGVFVEEVSYRAKSIEGVSTTTTGFVGPTRYGPLDIEPEIITSLVEFERVYGGKSPLEFASRTLDNYMWNAVRAFFEEGGKRLYVSRVFAPKAGSTGYAKSTGSYLVDSPPGLPPAGQLQVRARFPGRAGEGRVTITLQLGQDRLAKTTSGAALRGVANRDVVYIDFPVTSPPASPPSPEDGFYLATRDPISQEWSFTQGSQKRTMADLAAKGTKVRAITATVTFESASGDLPTFVATELALDPLHTTAGTPDSIFAYFADKPASLGRARSIPIVITIGDPAARELGDKNDGLDVLGALTGPGSPHGSPPDVSIQNLLKDDSTAADRSIQIFLEGGDDGEAPGADDYLGTIDAKDNCTGLRAFEAIEDISIVAAPGASYAGDANARAAIGHLINHAEKMRYRIAVVDSGKNQTISEVRAMRALFDSSHAAFYYPWIKIIDPFTGQENHYPPSGFVAGIYARNDVDRGVYKAPANEVVNLAIGFETLLNKGQQEVLNPEGVNCFRYFEGRGMRLWGARTMSSDPEWKYVNLRRYFAYLERSIDKGTQWAVFEPNGELLWANVRSTVSDFLLNEWQNGALLGEKPEKAFFVKCDRSTMSQNDLDNGRLVCLVGVAALRPAEFVIFRIGQWTADRKI